MAEYRKNEAGNLEVVTENVTSITAAQLQINREFKQKQIEDCTATYTSTLSTLETELADIDALIAKAVELDVV